MAKADDTLNSLRTHNYGPETDLYQRAHREIRRRLNTVEQQESNYNPVDGSYQPVSADPHHSSLKALEESFRESEGVNEIIEHLEEIGENSALRSRIPSALRPLYDVVSYSKAVENMGKLQLEEAFDESLGQF
jgi:hypothetical protein